MIGSRSILLPFLVALATAPAVAQRSVRDSSIVLVPVTVSYSYQVPGGSLATRFGHNSNLGLSAVVKLRSNYFLGAEGGFLFGNKVVEPGLLNGVRNAAGQVLDQNGQPATVFTYQRGYTAMAVVGKILPIVGPNPNSGLMLKLMGGYMRHKIRIETQNNTVPQLEGDYLEGYDRLCAGPAFGFALGYQHLGNRRFINFHVGFEMIVGLTTPLRAMNFDTGRSDTDRRTDVLTGLRAGWTVPIYRRKADSFYIY
ncbi:MAG: hypothetical protein IPJ87_17060 [Flavobacteriales bacterium]|jgi:hypothetical protein|nr:hypothetical protein [Flavobacteriales bacterium]MBK7943555.1 hypothetical protein [Flavobacteriales bacterium]MBK8950635.1 hypothetical protein [Flavobacteriales bacterium]MBK9699759.1 hypothetical protein [Flavobacteriales bacterium]